MNYLLFLSITIVATASPGPASFLAIQNGIRYGFGRSLFGMVGNMAAIFTMSGISIAGLGTIIMASAELFTLIKIAGAIYLVYLGIKAWRSNSQCTDNSAKVKINASSWRLFREAYFVGITNPKAIAFYMALFPQFIDLDKAVFPQFLLLVATFILCSFAFHCLYSALASRFKDLLSKEKARAWLNKISGGIFIGFGTVLATTSR